MWAPTLLRMSRSNSALCSSVRKPRSSRRVCTSTSPAPYHAKRCSTSSFGPAMKPSSDIDMPAITVAMMVSLTLEGALLRLTNASSGTASGRHRCQDFFGELADVLSEGLLGRLLLVAGCGTAPGGGRPVDRDVAGAVGVERPTLPVCVALLQFQTSMTCHQVQFAGPAVAQRHRQ